jgi:uncharacterized RDD family membrane protein YckC
MDQGRSISLHASSYQPGGGYPPQTPGYSPYSVPPPGWAPPSQPLAEPGPRILAFLIDRGIVVAIMLVAYFLFFVLAIGGGATGNDEGAAAGSIIGFLIFLMLLAVAIAFLLFNEIYLCGKNNGQSIGKKMMKIRIVKEGGGAFGYMDAFLRNVIGHWISGLVCGLGFFWGLFDAKRQAWHDKIFNTLVVKAE